MTALNVDLVCPRCYLRMELRGGEWNCRCGHRQPVDLRPRSKGDRIALALAEQRMKGD